MTNGSCTKKLNPPSIAKTHFLVLPGPSSLLTNTALGLLRGVVGTKLKFAQRSIVKSFEPNAHKGLLGTSTRPVEPSKLNAWLTLPGANVAPPCNVPLLPLIWSVASPSAGHHATIPGGIHDGTAAYA